VTGDRGRGRVAGEGARRALRRTPVQRGALPPRISRLAPVFLLTSRC
jgi:hypothetical protein